jgi:hypothetical protein
VWLEIGDCVFIKYLARLPVMRLIEYETSGGLDSLNQRLEEGYDIYEKMI